MLRSLIQYLRSVLLYIRFPTEAGYTGYRGIFNSFDEAIAAAPKTKKIGYNNPDLAAEYRDTFAIEIGFYDYPMLLWLKDLLHNGCRIFDFGGNIGTHFYRYEQYLKYPDDLTWTICELPEIIKAGETLAKQKNRLSLRFTDQFEQADGANIFIASGSVQYVDSLARLLENLPVKPQHILINRIPLCQGKPFVTLQNGGLVFYPVYVFNKPDFIQSICQLGYKLVDSWQDHSERCAIPFHPEFTSLTFSGLYFKFIQ
jgi:putative methyltransferase (TIGR04325 family)